MYGRVWVSLLPPEDVVRTMIEIVAPKSSDIVLDPACGTGTFLMETARFLSTQRSQRGPFAIYGVDKNPRMLLLADLNLGTQIRCDVPKSLR